MKLGIMRMPGHIPGAGYHYKLFPKVLTDEGEILIWVAMGYKIIDVADAHGERLLEEAQLSLRHEVEIAILAEKENRS